MAKFNIRVIREFNPNEGGNRTMLYLIVAAVGCALLCMWSLK